MKKIVRLTENDLMRIVKRVINEQTSLNPTPEKPKPIVADVNKVDRIFKGIIDSSGRFQYNYNKLTNYLNGLKPHNTIITNNNPDNPKNELIQAKKNYQYLISLIKQPKKTGKPVPYDTLTDFVSALNRSIGPIQSEDYKKLINLATQIDNQLK
jgi:hypothetical protein